MELETVSENNVIEIESYKEEDIDIEQSLGNNTDEEFNFSLNFAIKPKSNHLIHWASQTPSTHFTNRTPAMALIRTRKRLHGDIKSFTS